MDPYIIHKIALYVNDPKIVKLLFYIPEYNDFINMYDYWFDQLVLFYCKKDWRTDNLKIIKSFYRLNIHFVTTYMTFSAYNHMNLAVKLGYLEIVKWLYENKTQDKDIYAVNTAAYYGHLEIVKWFTNFTVNEMLNAEYPINSKITKE